MKYDKVGFIGLKDKHFKISVFSEFYFVSYCRECNGSRGQKIKKYNFLSLFSQHNNTKRQIISPNFDRFGHFRLQNSEKYPTKSWTH